jgi:hypothetical protein
LEGEAEIPKVGVPGWLGSRLAGVDERREMEVDESQKVGGCWLLSASNLQLQG